MTLDCTSTVSAACAEAFELFLQATPQVTPVSAVREIQDFDRNLDSFENMLLQSTIDLKWQMQHAADLLFFIALSILLLLMTLHFVANNIDAAHRFPIPTWVVFEGYLIILAWILNVKARTALALLFALKCLYKFVMTRREPEDADPEEEFPHEVFANLIQNFWRPILVCLIFAGFYERYVESYFNATSSDDFVEVVLSWDLKEDRGNWFKFCLRLLDFSNGMFIMLFLCHDPNTVVGEALQTFIEDVWEEIEERAMPYVNAIRRIIDRLRGVEGTDEVVRVGVGEHLEGIREVQLRIVRVDDLGH